MEERAKLKADFSRGRIVIQITNCSKVKTAVRCNRLLHNLQVIAIRDKDSRLSSNSK